MRRKTWVGMLAGIGFAGTVLAGGAAWGAAGDKASETAAAGMLSHQFVTVAYNRTRSTMITPELGAAEASVLLRAAQRLEPGNVHTAKLLVEAAGAAGESDVEREALRALIKLDPGDLVAQVKYIELLASGTQAIEERGKTFQSAMNNASLNPQIRSEMAVRLAGIASERGDVPGAKGLLQKAIQLNDVNVRALREMVKLSGGNVERMGAIVSLLTANPLEPDAWVEGSRILAGENLYGQAADFMTTGLEQIQMSGQQAGADMYLELGIDLAAAGRRAEAYPILESLGKLPDAPVSVLIAGELLTREYTPPATGPASQPASVDSAARIEAKLSEGMKGKDVSAEAIAEAVWVELSVLPTVGGETEGWLKKYEGMVGADDAGLMRLKGWWLLRAGKVDEARGMLEKGAASGDGLAQLGLARVLIEQGKGAEAGEQLRALWARNGGMGNGLLGFEAAQTARLAGIKLGEGAETAAVGAALGALPTTALGAHRHLRDMTLLSADFVQRNVALGEPVMLHLRVSNTSERAVPVGPGGLVSTTLGLSARSIGVDATNLGVYAIEDLQRVYRLERLAYIDSTMRVDQGALAELLKGNPRQSFTVEMAVVTSLRGPLMNTVPGLGGDRIPLGVFQRGGYGIGSGQDIERALSELPTVDLSGQMTRVQSLGLVVEMISDETVKATSKVDEDPSATESREKLRAEMTKGLLPLTKSDSAVMRAWMLLNLPQHGLNELQDVVMGMGTDPDAMVRVAWGWRMALTTGGLLEVKKVYDGEKDGMVKEWFGILMKDGMAHGVKGLGGEEGNGG